MHFTKSSITFSVISTLLSILPSSVVRGAEVEESCAQINDANFSNEAIQEYTVYIQSVNSDIGTEKEKKQEEQTPTPFGLLFNVAAEAPTFISDFDRSCRDNDGMTYSLDYVLSGEECSLDLGETPLEITGSSLIMYNVPICMSGTCTKNQVKAMSAAAIIASVPSCELDLVGANSIDNVDDSSSSAGNSLMPLSFVLTSSVMGVVFNFL